MNHLVKSSVNFKLDYQSLKPEDVIETNPPTFQASGKVIEAISSMNQTNTKGVGRRFSYILILEETTLVGILTESDIVRLTAAEIDLTQTKIDQVMTTRLITLKKSDFLDITTMIKMMRNHQIRHLPIVDGSRQIEGLVSVQNICHTLHPSNLLKFRRVEEAMTTEVFYASTTTSVLSLSKMMAKNHTNCIVILENQESESLDIASNSLANPVGIVTERDIVQFQILGMNIANISAQTVMSSPLMCLKTRDSLMEVRQQMEKLRVRQLVIVRDSGEFRGMITQFNMLKVLDPTELFGVIETLQGELEEKTIQLHQEKELAQITLQSIGDAVITTDDVGRIVNFNPIAEHLTGWEGQEVKGKELSAVFQIVNEHTRKPVPNPVEQVLKENRVIGLTNHTVLIALNGTEYAIEDSAAPIRDRQGQLIGAVIVFRDVTQSRSLTNQLSWQASHDALTELYNRRAFEQKLLSAISSAQIEKHCHSLCYLNLDRFKIVNDICGHVVGDKLLKQVAGLLQQQVRSSDTLARLGGDEFGFLLTQCPLSVAIEIANNLRQLIEDFRFSWQGRVFSIGVSIGLVEITSNAENLCSLMNKADAACCIAKSNGRNCIHVYRDNDVELSKNLGERQWIVKLNQALDEDLFCLYSQKIVSIKDQSENQQNIVNRYEILLRLQDEQGQIIPPSVFIPAAERYNLMPSIDRWVISHFMTEYHDSCQYDRNHQISRCNSVYAINLSGASLNSKQFRHFLKKQFDQFNIDPSSICFEITETTAISDLEIASRFIKKLKQLGCSIALDDFGSGMSSLNYLKNLPVDYLKIDGSFVADIVSNKVSRATVEYFTCIAEIMKIRTVAEFVEDDKILQQLQEMGVDYAQGYGIERPQPLSFMSTSSPN